MTKEELIEQLLKYRWDRTNVEIAIRAKCKCEYCGKNMLKCIDNYKLWQIDHIIPVSSGYSDFDDFDNKALSCVQCNKDFKRTWNPTSIVDTPDRAQYIEAIKKHVENSRLSKQKELDEINKIFEIYCNANKTCE